MPNKKTGREDVRKTVKSVMEAGLDFDDFDQFPKEMQVQYAREAKMILSSPVWQNETRRLINVWIEHLATESESYDGVLDMRMSISAIRLLDQHLRNLAARDGLKPTLEDPFSGI
jgi:hypothetical protein